MESWRDAGWSKAERSSCRRCAPPTRVRAAHRILIALGLVGHDPSDGIKAITIVLEWDVRCGSAWQRRRRSRLRREQLAFFMVDSTEFHPPVRRVGDHVLLIAARRADPL